MDGLLVASLVGCMYGLLDGLLDGWLYRLMDGWIDGWLKNSNVNHLFPTPAKDQGTSED
jgi:hypothetical protein